MTDLPRDIELELAALADGSLTGKRRERALERVRDSLELQGALAEQQRAVAMTADVELQAPASLHRRIEAMLEPQGARTRMRGATKRRGQRTATSRRVGFAAAVTATVLVVGALAIGLSENATPPRTLTVQQAAALTLSPATMPAPAESATHRAQLAAAVGGVPFPYWKERFGWRSSGARTDRVAGRSVVTVFYSNAEGGRVGYAIASGQAPATSGGKVVRRWGVPYRVLTHDGATVVTWARGGRLCVVSGRNVSARTLLNLASWGSERSRSA